MVQQLGFDEPLWSASFPLFLNFTLPLFSPTTHSSCIDCRTYEDSACDCGASRTASALRSHRHERR
eukprot:1807158-Rhodomonas_salina.1